MNSNSEASAPREKQPMKYFDERKRPISRSQWITDKLLMTYLAMNKPEPTPTVTAMMVQDLASELSDEQVLRGLARLRKEREWISVKAVIELSGVTVAADGRPEVENAWAMCPKSEEASVVWTEEMQLAFDGARRLLLEGDTIGARMAFKEAYVAKLAKARQDRRPVKWNYSPGYDRSDRVRVLMDAVSKKRLAPMKALELEPSDEMRLALPSVAAEHDQKLLQGDIQERGILPTQAPGFAASCLASLRGKGVLSADWEPEPPKRLIPKRTREEQLAHLQTLNIPEESKKRLAEAIR